MNKKLPLLVSFVLFLLLCASVTFWVLQFIKPPQRPVAASISMQTGDAPLESAIGLFGGSTTKVAMASNFQLKGVVVAGNANESIAILVANGKPPQSNRVNSEVMPGVTVKEVRGQYVLLSEGGVTRRVDLQEQAKNTMQSSAGSQFGGGSQSSVQRTEIPLPSTPIQMAPAMPTTMVMPGQPPPMPRQSQAQQPAQSLTQQQMQQGQQQGQLQQPQMPAPPAPTQ